MDPITRLLLKIGVLTENDPADKVIEMVEINGVWEKAK